MAATTAFSLCSLLMAALFGYSASVQLNDPDWYFWLPLYACACAVNLVNWAITKTTFRQIAKVTLWFATLMFLKVVIEDFVNGTAGFWSLDLSERVVREKTGSGLVLISMILHLEASSEPKHSKMPRNRRDLPRSVEYGMAILVIFSFGLPFVFFVIQDGEMKFDHVKEQNHLKSLKMGHF
ncbi:TRANSMEMBRANE PROTEIN 220 [Salix purpurea]|uniref:TRANSMEMBRANE PROTEIN 220 n=1 Tax=Salix purpurea TaxID=77065 RepID=A0A9Q0ZMS0_SALPP|nr:TRANSMEMBRANE PROTEIN 220 [Salix purpurea]